jgi:hypothetical protein
MKSKLTLKLVGVTAVVVCTVTFVFAFGYVGNSKVRVIREHGLRVPSSASHFVCKGGAWFPFLDRVADSTFEMGLSELGSFTNQLRLKTPDAISAAFASPDDGRLATYYCESPTGDFLFVSLWRMDDSRVRVRLFTDWN